MLELIGITILILLSIIICCNRSPMYSIFSFIAFICLLSTYLIKHGVEFVAIAFLIIYIGAIMVIFLFVIFLLNLYNPTNNTLINKFSFIDIRITTIYRNIVMLIIVVKITFINMYLANEIKSIITNFPHEGLYNYEEICIFAELKLNLLYFYDINAIGYLLYSKYSIYLILCALIIFTALTGSVTIVINNMKDKEVYK